MRAKTAKESALINSKRSLQEPKSTKKVRAKVKIDKTNNYIIPNVRTNKQTYVGYKGNPKNVIILSDFHEPFSRAGYLDFCLSIQKKYDAGTVINIGDEIDLCAVSQYNPDPDGMSPGDEIKTALERLRLWYKAFPKVNVCIGNHTARIYRKAKECGIPKGMIKTFNDMFEAPKTWQWADSWDVQGVHYTHGTGSSGPQAAIKRAVLNQQSTVMGHLHSEASIQYSVSKKHKLFGMIVGSGVDDDAYAFHYGKDMQRKSVISCGVVLDGGKLPIIELMNL